MSEDKPKSGTLEYQRAWHRANRDKVKQQRALYYQQNKDKVNSQSKERYLQRKFRLSVEEYNSRRSLAMSCEICQGPFEKGPELDHCHSTGNLRGWLCGKCNRMLGLVNDSISILQEAIKYLEKHGRTSD